AVDVDVVAERRRRQHFQAQAVVNEVFEGDGRAQAVADVQVHGAAGQGAVVAFRGHLVGAEGQGPVAGRLGGGGQGEARRGHGEQGGGEQFHRFSLGGF